MKCRRREITEFLTQGCLINWNRFHALSASVIVGAAETRKKREQTLSLKAEKELPACPLECSAKRPYSARFNRGAGHIPQCSIGQSLIPQLTQYLGDVSVTFGPVLLGDGLNQLRIGVANCSFAYGYSRQGVIPLAGRRVALLCLGEQHNPFIAEKIDAVRRQCKLYSLRLESCFWAGSLSEFLRSPPSFLRGSGGNPEIQLAIERNFFSLTGIILQN